ncbi:hypothetical protein WN51_01968 [Melipona quadrifasciata]|uniref:Uncharacterized protein n=1 Tax=Melipona quadrifasciata TaxID=166423 RepID=A0A0M9AAS7_9HYME|nr:hypothetical protein WN51_01968 [Melipona quadrifasciata]
MIDPSDSCLIRQSSGKAEMPYVSGNLWMTLLFPAVIFETSKDQLRGEAGETFRRRRILNGRGRIRKGNESGEVEVQMVGRNKGIGEHAKEENSIAKSERSRNRRNSEEERVGPNPSKR